MFSAVSCPLQLFGRRPGPGDGGVRELANARRTAKKKINKVIWKQGSDPVCARRSSGEESEFIKGKKSKKHEK